MTRSASGDPGPGRGGPDPGRAAPPLRPLGVGTLVLAGLIGVLIGLVWALAVSASRGFPPTLSAVGLISLGFVVLALALAARYMGRVRRRTAPVDPHLAVRLLAMGRAGAVVGAVAAGVYLGLGLQRITSGLTAGGGGRQLLYAGLGVLAGAAVLVAGLLVERACRRPDGPDPDDPDGPPAVLG